MNNGTWIKHHTGFSKTFFILINAFQLHTFSILSYSFEQQTLLQVTCLTKPLIKALNMYYSNESRGITSTAHNTMFSNLIYFPL